MPAANTTTVRRPPRATKRWATTDSTGGGLRIRGSKTATYNFVVAQRELFEAGETDVRWVQVYVHEGDGRGWQNYERVDFADA